MRASVLIKKLTDIKAPAEILTGGENVITSYQEAAESAGLQYVSDIRPGYRRRRSGKGFIYLTPDNQIVNSDSLKERFKKLVIPPAWTDVWICPNPRGHIQATGRDAKGRKQYIYHPEWDEVRNQTKFDKLAQFGEALPLLRNAVEEDLRLRNMNRKKVLAVIVDLLDKTSIRIGNPEYAKDNGSFGLTTLQNGHIDISGIHVKFVFRGKSGKEWLVQLKDKRLARLVKQCQELPGQDVFRYIDEDGNYQTIDSMEVNDYIRSIAGDDFSAKDFRTWNGTVIAACELSSVEPGISERENKRKITAAVRKVAQGLVNTPSVCRKYYIHPLIINAFTSGKLQKTMDDALKADTSTLKMRNEEIAVLSVLKSV